MEAERDFMYPVFAQKGASIPRKKIFKGLRNMWIDVDTRRTNAELAVVMETTPQALSSWLSDNSNRSPSWWTIMRLCYLLDLQITVNADEIEINHRELQDDT